MIFSSYIDDLISNINSENIPKEIDLVLDGGAFNGIYQLGSLMYLHHLEEKKLITINRISGTSIGAVMGLIYILGNMDFAVVSCEEMLSYFKKKLNMGYFRKRMNCLLKEHMKKEDYLLANNRLYITYFNNKTKKQIIKCKYKSNEDLIEQIIKSAYLPFLSDGNIEYDNSVDGVNPYIFKKTNKRKIIFIRLMSQKQFTTSINVKNEINIYTRILEGILDINKFFTTGNKTIMCSYIDEWNILDFGIFRLRELCWIIFLIILDMILYVNKNIPNSIKNSHHFAKLKTIFYNFYVDIFSHMLT
jgi:hypothetical protein